MNSILNVTLGVLIITAIIVFLPTGSLPTEIITSFENIFGYLYMFDAIIPINTILQIISLFVTFELVIYSWKALNWISRLLKGQ